MKQLLPLISLLCGFLMASSSMLFAQNVASDKELLANAQQAVAVAHWDEVVTAVESLRQHYPTSAVLPEGMVLLCQAYFAQKNPDKAGAVGREIVVRWPRSHYVWLVVRATCENKAKVSPAAAADALGRALKQDMLAAEDCVKAETLRFHYLQSVQFAETATEVQSAAGLAMALYPSLLKSMSYDDVKSLHQQVGKALLQCKLGKLAREETAKWLGAVARIVKNRAMPELQESLQQSLAAQSADEVLVPVGMIAKMYSSYFSQMRNEEAQALHARVQAMLQHYMLTDDALLDSAQYTCEEVMAQRTVDMEQYLSKAPQQLRTIIDHAPSMPPLNQVSRVLGQFGLYRDLLLAGRMADARDLYEQMHAAFLRVGPQSLPAQSINTRDYLMPLSQTDLKGFLSSFLPLVEKATTGGSAQEVKALAAIVHVVYQALLKAGYTDTVTNVHTQLQAIMQRTPSMKTLAQAENNDYFIALCVANPAAFMAEVKTVDEVLKIAPLVQKAYAPLNKNGGFLDARTAHDQLQTLLTKFNRTTEAEDDKKKFQDSLSIPALESMLQLFTKSLAVPDRLAAKKWLDELNAIAPEAPQATRARALWKEHQGQ